MATLPERDISQFGFHIGFHYDKLNHFSAFAVLGLVGSFGWRKQPAKLAVFLLFIGALIEILQGLPLIGRDRDFFDWVADLLGVVLGVGASLWLQRCGKSTRHRSNGV